MLRKIINIYVTTEGSDIRLRTVEMQHLDKSTPVTALTRANTLNFPDEIELVVEAIYSQQLDHLQLLQPILEGRDVPLLDYFNQLPGDREQNRDQLRNQLVSIWNNRTFWMSYLPHAYMKVHHIGDETIVGFRQLFDSYSYGVYDARDGHHPDHEYAYHDFSARLPADRDSLVKLIGSLDSFMYLVETIARENGYLLWVNFCNDQPNLLDRNQVIADSVMKVTSAKQPKSRVFARFIAERLIEEADKNPLALSHYYVAATALKEIVKTETPYLCRVIHELLYPTLSIQAFLQINAPNNQLMFKLFDPATSFLATTSYLIEWLLSQLSSANYRESAHAEFNAHQKIKNDFWDHTLNSLFGLPAPDGGYYYGTYTEIMLLREAVMRINSDGLIELDIYQTKSYKEYYQVKDAPNHAVLEEEVRAVFRHLGLEILSGLDFHRNIIFTRASSIALLNRGIHYSENYAKGLARASHHYRFFTSIESQRADLPALPLEVKTRIISFIEPELHEGELQLMSTRKFG